MKTILLGVTTMLAFALVASPLRAQNLKSSIERLPRPQRVVIVELASGDSVLERFRAGQLPARVLRPNQPLVVILQVPQLNSPDRLAVTRAAHDRARIRVDIERHEFTGPLAANVVSDGYIEVQLGALPKGTYRVELRERKLSFAIIDKPETAGNPQKGLHSTVQFTL